MSAEDEKCPICGVEMRIHPLLCQPDSQAHCAVGSASSQIAKQFCTYTPQAKCTEEYLTALILPLERKLADLWEISVSLKRHAEEVQSVYGIHAEAIIEEAETILKRVNEPLQQDHQFRGLKI